MTVPSRAKIIASLAEAGRPLMWADENQAAVLSGFSPERFRREVRGLELRGFPPINSLNGKRSIPAILAFWKLPANDTAAGPAPDDRTVENWDDERTTAKRRLSRV
jgi:hypothetical protein